MTQSTIDILISHIGQADHSVKLYLANTFTTDLYETLQSAVRNRIVLELVIGERCKKVLASDIFLLNKLFQLRESGGSIFASESTSSNQAILQVDFDQTVIIDNNDQVVFYSDNAIEVDQYKNWFSDILHNEPEYRSEPGDIVVNLKVSNTTVIEASKTVLEWEVTNAKEITIDGIGPVDPIGRQEIRLLGDTVVFLSASNEKQKKFRSLQIRTAKKIEIDYKVEFLNPTSKEYVTLPEEEKLGVFGVAKGHQLRVQWHVPDAEKVMITPFNIESKSGSFEFKAKGTTEVVIEAIVQRIRKVKRLIIHEYPMPILEEKFVQPDPQLTNPLTFSYQDFTSEAKATSEASIPSLIELKSVIDKQEAKLWQQWEEIGFKQFYGQHSIPNLNQGVLERLRAYFRKQPKVQQMIDSIKYYYE